MGTVRIMFYEGHIRNWRELCSELSVPHKFERDKREHFIILRGYQKWGENLPKHLFGMFSFAINDNGYIFGARDHFGIKPFYYCELENELLLSANIHNILENSSYQKLLDPTVLQYYLSFSYVPGRKTLFSGIQKLMPGEILIYANGKLKTEKYWEPRYNIDEGKSLSEWAEILHGTMEKVMGEIVEPDEIDESIVMLSAGVDSSYILAASNINKSCTVGFFEKEYDESKAAYSNAIILGRQNYITRLSKEAFLENVRSAIKTLGLPIGTPATIAYKVGCELASKHAKIFLSGEGADEFFCGYDVYKLPDILTNVKEEYIGKANIMSEAIKQSILKKYITNLPSTSAITDLYSSQTDLDVVTQMSNVDIRVWLEGNSFLNVQRMSSAHGIEARLPIVDVRIFEIVSQIPSKYKVRENANKLVFRKCAEKILPIDVANREKNGFVIPMRYWLLSPLYESEIIRAFTCESSRLIFNSDKLLDIYAEYKAGNLDLWKPIWNIYIFLIWYDIFFITS